MLDRAHDSGKMALWGDAYTFELKNVVVLLTLAPCGGLSLGDEGEEQIVDLGVQRTFGEDDRNVIVDETFMQLQEQLILEESPVTEARSRNQLQYQMIERGSFCPFAPSLHLRKVRYVPFRLQGFQLRELYLLGPRLPEILLSRDPAEAVQVMYRGEGVRIILQVVDQVLIKLLNGLELGDTSQVAVEPGDTGLEG